MGGQRLTLNGQRLYAVQCTPCTVGRVLYVVQCTLYTVQYTTYTVHYIVRTVYIVRVRSGVSNNNHRWWSTSVGGGGLFVAKKGGEACGVKVREADDVGESMREKEREGY